MLTDYFSTEKKILKICGISLFKENGSFYVIYSIALLLFTPYTYFALAMFEDCFQSHSFEEICVLLIYNSCAGLACVKIAVLLLNRQKIISLLNCMHCGVFAPNEKWQDGIEIKLITNCIKSNSKQRKAYFLALAASVGATIINSVTSRISSDNYEDWEFGFGKITLINTTYSPNYEIAMVSQNLGAAFGSVQFVIFDLLFANILSQICVQFEILKNNLKKIVENGYNTMFKDLAQKQTVQNQSNFAVDNLIIPKYYLCQALKEVVVHHLSILYVVKAVDKIYGIILLVVFLTNGLTLCFILYMCSTVPLNDPQVIPFFGMIAAMSCQSFMMCYWCDNVTTQSETVGQIVLESNFIGTNLEFQKELLLIMKRSFKPSTISAKKFFIITLQMFTKTLRAAYSFFMIVQKQNSMKRTRKS